MLKIGQNWGDCKLSPQCSTKIGTPGTRVLLYAKMLIETETEKKVFFVTVLSLVAFRLGGPGLSPPTSPLGYTYEGA